MLCVSDRSSAAGVEVAVEPKCHTLLCKDIGSASPLLHFAGTIGIASVLKCIGAAVPPRDAEEGYELVLRAPNAKELFITYWALIITQLMKLPTGETRIGDLFDEMAAAIDCGHLHKEVVAFIQQFDNIQLHWCLRAAGKTTD